MKAQQTISVLASRVQVFDAKSRRWYPADQGPPSCPPPADGKKAVPAPPVVALEDPAGPFAKLSPTRMGQEAGRRWALEHATWEDLEQLRAEVERGLHPLFLNAFADAALDVLAEMEGR